MAKKSKKNQKQQQKQPQQKKKARAPEEEDEEDEITWDDIVAMSDSDDDATGDNNDLETNAKVKSLKDAFDSKKFQGLLSSLKKKAKEGDDDEDEFEEDVLGSSSDEDDDDDDDDAEPDQVQEEEEEEEEDDQKKVVVADNDSDEEDQDEEEDERESTHGRLQKNNTVNSKALSVVTQQLASNHTNMSWAETFVVVPATPLPFGEHGDLENNPLDIHDDLKREVAFYNTALEAVHEARAKAKVSNVPFSRPEDFFAEMVKTDDHMAKVKDRLIFENKKIEAVAQRRANKEQKLRAKESQSNRLMEKAKRKRDHFQQVEEWANSAARNRGGALQDDFDDRFLNKRGEANKKRQAADRKFGHGGRKGRFKQNDRQSMNDMSGYNPRGNFAGGGMKKTSQAAKGGSGASRTGKRARDAKRARR
mmetsp:Transcript_1577/g.3510  ORF Transcript_1577/g.3510 Transcript_1577/m.3510 type:complete len:420 (+) Transcript_1577:100-1359(+)